MISIYFGYRVISRISQIPFFFFWQQYTLNVWSWGKQLVLFSRESWNIKTWGKTKLTSFPRDHTLSVLLYLDFYVAKTNKQRRRAGNNCAIVSRSGYIWFWSGARDHESTNHSAHFVEWKSSYITNGNYSRLLESIGPLTVSKTIYKSTLFKISMLLWSIEDKILLKPLQYVLWTILASCS